MRTTRAARHTFAFTLIELLVVVSVIGLLLSLLVPSLSGARQQARSTKCLAQLRVLGQGITMYTLENGDVLVPGRLPDIDDCAWQTQVAGGIKYRPTFLAIMGTQIGLPAFDDPKACKTEIDVFGEEGDRQDYSSSLFVCPQVSNWTDERNGSYGYNYQFLGNSRLRDSSDPESFKHWPVVATRVKSPAGTVAVGDCMGTAASFPPGERGAYINNARDANRLGNEGFNLDPPRVDPVNGEMAGLEGAHRTASDDRHRGRLSILFVDSHVESMTREALGYDTLPDGVIGFEGNNRMWSLNALDEAWTQGE
jgi:prepilin-type N-terminal cleavage/methylation domain-containing protein/prepilin-type processing-associated H-X9-DG protein